MKIKGFSYLYQWDKERELEVPEEGAIYVDYAIPGGEPLRVEVADGIAKIPDSWLQTPGDQKIFICYQNGTIQDHILRVRPRPKPPGYIAGPDKAQDYSDLDKRISELAAALSTHESESSAKFDEINSALDNLTHTHATVTSLAVSPNTVKQGTTLDSVLISGQVSKMPQKLVASINSVEYKLPASERFSQTISGIALTKTTQITVSATDEKGHNSARGTSVNFFPALYYGVGVEYPDAPSEKLQGNRVISFTVSPGEGEYIWYACPVSYSKPVFYVGGFEGGFTEPEIVTIDGLQYYRCHSFQPNLGKTTVEVR